LRARLTRAIGPHVAQIPGLRHRLIGWRAIPIEGNVCDERLAVLLGLGDRVGATDMGGQSAAISRAQMAESSLMVEDDACADVSVKNLVLEQDGIRLPARLYVPTGLYPNSPGIVYYHGGGFVMGDLDTHDRHCQHLAREISARVIAIDYRLAPENPFPAAAEDAVRAFRSVVRRSKEFGMDASRLVVMGDSAGGNLSALVAHKTKKDDTKPVLQVLVYPAVDGTCSMKSHRTFGEGWLLTAKNIEWFYHCYVGDDPVARKHADVSPLFAEDFQGLPPALVYTAGFDPLRDEGIAYAERLEKAGVAVRHHCFGSLTHGFASMGGLCPAAREATRHISRDVQRVLREGISMPADAAE